MPCGRASHVECGFEYVPPPKRTDENMSVLNRYNGLLYQFSGTFILLVVGFLGRAHGQLLSTPYPEPSSNAALHYNRALLSMSMIPVEERDVLAKPISEAFGGLGRDEIQQRVSRLTHEGRHAIRAAIAGTSCDNAEFGIDYSDYGHGVALPHADPMLQLGRLLTLAGIHAQLQEDWEQAAVLLFNGLRMGRHMADQPTLTEAIIGVQILENNYFALAFWGAKCPDSNLVRQAFFRFEAASEGIVRPAFTLASEASIIERQMGRVRTAFPDGSWAVMLLDSLGEFTIAEDEEALQKKAIKICVDRGVPESVFESKSSFDTYVSKLSTLRSGYFRSLAACMTIPPKARMLAADRVYQRAKAQLERLSKAELLPPEQLVSIFATHDAERTMTRVALGVVASRTNEGLPDGLAAVARRFYGQLPASPHDGSQLKYQLLNGGKDFSVTVPAAKIGDLELPPVEFSSLVSE